MSSIAGPLLQGGANAAARPPMATFMAAFPACLDHPMTRLARLLQPFALCAISSTCSLAAQATLTVGPGGYAQISDALLVAQPGDRIVVQPGSYLPFDVAIGVRIVAPTGATITTPPGGGGIPGVRTVQPPAGQQATIAGLTFANNTVYPPAEPPVTVRAFGNVVFADCEFRNSSDYPSNAVVCNGDVQFDRCRWSGVWDCLSVIGGRVVANECVFTPFEVMWASPNPSPLVANAGNIELNFCELRGAPYGTTFSGAPAVRLSGSATLSVADCLITGGNSASWASTAIVNSTTQPVRHARSYIAGGQGTLSWYPPLSGPGPAFSGPEQPAMIVGGGGAQRPSVGGNYFGSVSGATNSLAVVILSFERSAAMPFPLTAQPIHFDPAQAFVFAGGTLAASLPWPGTGTYTWQVGTLPAGLVGVQFWMHTLVWDGSIFQVGPTAGGLVY